MADVGSVEGRHWGENRQHRYRLPYPPAHQGEAGANGSGLPGVAVTTFRDAWDHGPARDGGSHSAIGLALRLVPVYLRLAIGVPELAWSLDKFQHLPAFVAMWHRIHLPAAEILAPAYAAANLFGALLLLAGWQTRTVAALFVAELLSEILLTKRPLVRLLGWMLEWQSLWVVLILARIGAGPWSLDWHSARRRAQDSPANR